MAERKIEMVHNGDQKGIWDEIRLSQVLSNLISNARVHGLRGKTNRGYTPGQRAFFHVCVGGKFWQYSKTQIANHLRSILKIRRERLRRERARFGSLYRQADRHCTRRRDPR